MTPTRRLGRVDGRETPRPVTGRPCGHPPRIWSGRLCGGFLWCVEQRSSALGEVRHEVGEDLAALRGERVVDRRAHAARFAVAEEAEEALLLGFGDELRVELGLRRLEADSAAWCMCASTMRSRTSACTSTRRSSPPSVAWAAPRMCRRGTASSSRGGDAERGRIFLTEAQRHGGQVFQSSRAVRVRGHEGLVA